MLFDSWVSELATVKKKTTKKKTGKKKTGISSTLL